MTCALCLFKEKRQETNCVCDQTDTQTDFDDGTTELSSTDKCTCLTLTPVLPPAKVYKHHT